MRRSNRFGFGGVEEMTSAGQAEIAVADLTGDSRAGVIVRRSNNGPGARIRRNWSIPIRFVLFDASVTEQQLLRLGRQPEYSLQSRLRSEHDDTQVRALAFRWFCETG